MSAADPLPKTSPKIDVRTLSLTQLQRLSAGGSRRARAELERRMAEADAQVAPIAPSHARPAESADAARADARADAPARPRLVTAASMDEMAALAAASAASGVAGDVPGMGFPGNHDAPARAIPPEAEILRLQALARQEDARQRAEGPPGLIGMALMAWGALVLLGGLTLLTRTGGLYYILFGLACAGVGWLLFRCKRLAIWAHAACVAVALLWAWRGYAGSNALTALIQSAPVWVPAFWIAVPPVREPLS